MFLYDLFIFFQSLKNHQLQMSQQEYTLTLIYIVFHNSFVETFYVFGLRFGSLFGTKPPKIPYSSVNLIDYGKTILNILFMQLEYFRLYIYLFFYTCTFQKSFFIWVVFACLCIIYLLIYFKTRTF